MAEYGGTTFRVEAAPVQIGSADTAFSSGPASDRFVTGQFQLPTLRMAGTANLRLDGACTLTLPALRVEGNVLGPNLGVGTFTLSNLSFAGEVFFRDGQMRAAWRLPALRAEGAAEVAIGAIGLLTLPALRAEGRAGWPIALVGVVRLAAPTLVAEGENEAPDILEYGGEWSLPPLCAAIHMLVPDGVVGDWSLPVLRAEAIGNVPLGVIGAMALPGLHMEGSGTIPVFAAAEWRLPALRMGGEVGRVNHADAVLRLKGLTMTSLAAQPVEATATITLPALGTSISARLRVKGGLVATLPPLILRGRLGPDLGAGGAHFSISSGAHFSVGTPFVLWLNRITGE